MQASPTTRVVMFSGFEEQGLVDKTRELGAVAFIEKSASLETLIQRLVGSSARTRPWVEPAATSRPRPGRTRRADLRGPASPRRAPRAFPGVFEEAAIGMATTTLWAV